MSSTQEYNCILCKETFDTKEDLLTHFRKHGDPKFNQNQKGKFRPQNEAQTSAEKKSEETEMVACDVCPEMFPTISKAITHKHKVHPDHDAKYFCPWCGKLFTLKHLYNKHLQSNHLDQERIDVIKFHCDPCDVDFFVPSAMLYHNKFFHRQDTDLPIIGQSKKLKMCQQEALQIYYCAFCGDEYDNKVNLHKHMTDDHSDENQSPEDVLRCPLCEAIFYHLDAYEVHLTFHTSEDLYREANEIFEQTTEFSLETVPPIVEKVENVEPQEDVESAMNAVGIEKFLEMAMDNTLEEDKDNTKSKSKKHKKHKKKKKEAITLNEFLNMNKDVFGEGLDFQGIEEVPTQVVAKRLKQKKANQSTATLKVAQSSELEKLKKQGIVVKMKTTKKPIVQNIKVGNEIRTKGIMNVNKPSTNVLTTPDQVLSKLMNQSNSQIKIVKKSSQENTDSDQLENQTVENKRRSATPENIEVECDVNIQSEYTSSENETKEDTVKNEIKTDCNDQQKTKQSLADTNTNEKCKDLKQSETLEELCNNDDKLGNNNKESENDSENIKTGEASLPIDKHIEKNPVATLLNTGGLTIKSVARNVAQAPPEHINDKNHYEEKDNKDNGRHEDASEQSNNASSNSINALKHLSHLITVKSVVPTNSTPVLLPKTRDKESKTIQPQDDSDLDEEEKVDDLSKNIQQSQAKVNKEKSISSLNSLKTLSKNITIKPVTHSPKRIMEKSDDYDEGDEDDNEALKSKSTDSENQALIPNKSAISIKNPDNNLPSPKTQSTSQTAKHANTKDIPSVQDKQTNMNFLKHLTNVTAKPINSARSNSQQVNNAQNITKQNVTPQTLVNKQEICNDVEIYNIDDSDDEIEKVQPAVNKTLKPNPIENTSTKSLDTFKNISKHVTVKTVNQPKPVTSNAVKQANNNKQEQIAGVKNQYPNSDFSDDDDDQNTLKPTNKNTIQQKLKLQNDHLQNTLKHLGKHITVKSGNPSPNSIKSGKDHNSRDDFDNNDAADSNDSYSGKVKITEMTDDQDLSDDDIPEQSNKINQNKFDKNVNVKSPGGSNSDPDNFDEADDDFPDFENEIKASTVKKPIQNVNKIANFKNVTIKSLADKKVQEPKEVDSNAKNILPNINKELSIKPFKKIKTECPNTEETFANKKSIMNAAQVKRSIINQNQSINRNIASTSQQNTVNKEVTVKTFQTKTVIQEITTTVTKTIKTVNQTVKQEVQSTSQNNVMKFQKVQGMKSTNQQIKNFQGVTVRHANPMAGTKIRGGVPPNIASNIRPANQVAPCNQLVPVRPARNTARMSVPRMPTFKKNIAPTAIGNQPRPPVGRPLKISPNAVSSIKRPAEEPTGHFSCFKKPKESLIPGSDISAFTNESGESTSHYSSSQMSKSNFTSATKTVRGNTVVTQMRSEVSASSQHLEKLNNMSGLKVVKTSQSKQAVKVEEKCEMSPSKRNTLEAIEKLQKQGLLVKKPRLEDVSNDSDHSEECDDYITEEPDD